MADENAEQNENETAEETDVAETELETTEEPMAEAEAEQPAAEADLEPAEAEAAPAAEEVEPTEPEPTEEPVAEAEPADGAAEPAAEGEEPAAVPGRKKRKHLPRSERRQRSKPKREQPAERKPITRIPKPEHARGRRQERQGAVVSAAGDKTIVVRVDTVKAHPMYKKVIRRSTRLHAHDEQNEAKVGDVVRIVETRPLSKLKRWRLQEIVEAAK